MGGKGGFWSRWKSRSEKVWIQKKCGAGPVVLKLYNQHFWKSHFCKDRTAPNFKNPPVPPVLPIGKRLFLGVYGMVFGEKRVKGRLACGSLVPSFSLSFQMLFCLSFWWSFCLSFQLLFCLSLWWLFSLSLVSSFCISFWGSFRLALLPSFRVLLLGQRLGCDDDDDPQF